MLKSEGQAGTQSPASRETAREAGEITEMIEAVYAELRASGVVQWNEQPWVIRELARECVQAVLLVANQDRFLIQR